MNEKKNGNKKKYEYDFIQFAVSKEAKKRYEEYAKSSEDKTLSKFIRNAIEERIIRIDQNIPLIQNTKGNLSIKQIEKIIDNRLSNQNEYFKQELAKISSENKELYNKITNDFEVLQSYINSEDFQEETNNIINLLKAHKSLTPKDIMDYTKLTFKEIFQILSNTDIFNLNSATGRFELNE
ncbi:MAG: hypothetical protein ACTSRG_20285 [Candidatus Helarchaeota archaeon]